MTKLSRIYLDPNKERAVIELFWDAITLLEDRDEIKAFLKELLTPTEIRMLSKRFSIAKMLADGYDYQTITSFLKVTPGTIASVNSKLSYGDGGFDPVLERMLEIEKQKQERLEGKRDLLKPPAGGIDPFEVLQFVGKQLKKRAKRRSVKR